MLLQKVCRDVCPGSAGLAALMGLPPLFGVLAGSLALDRYFTELGHVQHIAAAFAAAMNEVGRRSSFKQAYQAEAAKAVSALQQMQDAGRLSIRGQQGG